MNVTRCVERLRSQLDDLAPFPGDRLPAERILAGQIGCSRQTLRNALSELMREDLIWRHVGQGTFRGPRPKGQPLRDAVLIEVTSPRELIEARRVLEPPVAAVAARVASGEDAMRLMQRVADGRNATDVSACEQADTAFHRTVADIAGNPVLLGVLAYLSDVRRRSAWQHEWGRTYRRVGVEEFRGLHSDQHAVIAQAIAEHDISGAENAMREHLETIEAMMGVDSSNA